MDRTTLIEDAPQISIRRIPPGRLQPRSALTSPLSDSFPTPKADCSLGVLAPVQCSPTSSDSPGDANSIWSKRSSRSEFDELYDVSSSESEGDVPIKLSHSIKRRIATSKNRYPPLVIPSPSLWPTVDKLKSAVTPLSPPPIVDLVPSILAKLNSAHIPSNSSTPSLDGNSTDEELPLSSCPSTPDIARQDHNDSTWEVPIQLDPSSINLLQHLNGEKEAQPTQTVIEMSDEAVREMREIVESPRQRMRIDTQNLTRADPIEAENELSDLSIPTPGGFFAGLSSAVARHTWCAHTAAPTTSVATEFYDVPFRNALAVALPTSTAARFYDLPWESPDFPVRQTICVESPIPFLTEPITARRIVPSPTEGVVEVDEIDERYDEALRSNAALNMGRTMLWLNAQNDYMKAVCEEDEVFDSFKDIPDVVPTTPDQPTPQVLPDTSPSKKTVRWADEKSSAVESKAEPEKKKRISPIHDGTFWEGWRHTKRSARARDVFQQRQARAEAEHVRRTSCSGQHIEQLQGKFAIRETERPTPSRPISDLIAKSIEDQQNDNITRAERERKAWEQMQSSAWHVSAQKEISGGRLLTSPVAQSFKGRTDVRILDVQGQVHCSWAWNVALEHPDAMVYTTVSSDAEAHVAESTLDGPANHSVVAAPRPWELPFPDSHFDVISARNLYSTLKTMWPKGCGADEWDLTLRECLRCLKPGGYFEFILLDAELIHPEAAGQALGVEFAFNLKTRGYDPSAGRIFLPRLKRAGFHSIKRAWMILPVADVTPRWVDSGKSAAETGKVIGPDEEVEICPPAITGSTRDVRAMTGIVGARMWEQWMLKLNSEMGRDEQRCLEGVSKALEDCGKGRAGWRCLVGWARKGV